MKRHRVRVSPLPTWLDAGQLLGDGAWRFTLRDAHVSAEGELESAAAADLAARLRGVVLAGARVVVEVVPPLSRSLVRRGRLEEARRTRDRSPSFTRPGVQIDTAAKLGLTPERLAVDIARRAGKLQVIDTCCGAGGNAIGFARAGCTVTAIEIDAARLAMAQHNAAVYGVADRIEWLHGDACELLPRLLADLWFVDVPWQHAADANANAAAAAAEPSDLNDPAVRALLDRILVLRPAGQRAWIKVPGAFDPATIAGALPRAYFGVAAGDARRVKFVVLELNG